jgi:serine protease
MNKIDIQKKSTARKVKEVFVKIQRHLIMNLQIFFMKVPVIWLFILLLVLSIEAKGPSDQTGVKSSQSVTLPATGGSNESSFSNRNTLPGIIIVKFKSQSPFNSTNPAVLSKGIMDRFQIYRIEQTFPFLNKNTLENNGSLNRIYYLHYSSNYDPIQAAAEISRDPALEYAEPKYLYPLLDIPNDPQYSTMTQFPFIQADTAWGIIKGEIGEVVIAIVDGGTDWNHSDLLGNVWTNPGEIAGNGIDDDGNGFIDDVHGWNFSNNTNDPTGNTATPQSAAHGTHVAGIAAGVTDNSVGVSSISWNCRFMPVNASHPTIDWSIAHGYEAIAYAAANGADIINCSWGGLGGASSFEQDVIDFAYANGTLVVAAAGNNQNNNDFNQHYPSGYQHVLSVGAINKSSDDIAGFTNYGISVNVFAPGVNILSTTPNNNYSSNYSGTSMSSPLVAGLAGLVKTQNPDWNVDQVREQIRVNCVSIDASNPSYSGLLGKGKINALRTVTNFNSPSIRIIGNSFLDSGGDGIINSGETVDLQLSFTNYLTSASNVSFTLSTSDNNITITSANGQIGSFNTNDTLEIPFQFQVAQGLEDGYVLRFVVNTSSAGYSDRELFKLMVNPPQFAVHNTGSLQTSITTQGNIGWIDFQGESNGVGFLFNGEDYLFEGGLMLGTSSTQVSDCIRGADGQTQDDDFRPAANECLSIVSPGQISTEEGTILLVDSLAASPLGISILQKTYADTTTANQGFVIFKYQIANPTPNPITNFYAGLFFDWDIIAGTGVDNWARYDSTRKMGYVQNAASNPNKLAGTRLLTSNNNISYRSIDNFSELYDGFTDLEKWNFLSGGIQTQSVDGVDISTLTAEGPFNIPAGGMIEVAFALIGGNSLAELQTNADQAQNFWNRTPGAVTPSKNIIPQNFSLEQNYPNPFNPSTIISWQLAVGQEVELKIFNLLGQEVRTLINKKQEAGYHSIVWDGQDDAGHPLASGIYLYKLEAGEYVSTRKMVLLK